MDIKNNKNKFPIDIAIDNDDWEIVEFVIKLSNKKDVLLRNSSIKNNKLPELEFTS